MTVKIKNKKLYDIYKNTMVAVATHGLTLTDTLKMLSDYIILNGLTRGHDDEIAIIVEAIINGKKVELDEPKYAVFIPLDNEQRLVAQASEDFEDPVWEFSTYDEICGGYGYSKEQVDRVRKRLPYIQTMQVIN